MLKNNNFVFISLFPILFLNIFNLYSEDIYKSFQNFATNFSLSKHPYIGLNITEIVQLEGYPIETHEFYTEDGYGLLYFRIPFGRNSSKDFKIQRPPVLIHHGFGSSAADFFNLGPEKSLPYKLADEGSDVWIANFRGNTYSRKHLNFDPDSKEYWNFTFDEIGRYDLPAGINYILKVTNETNLSYIGHSLGSTIYFVTMSTNPELNDKVNLMIALAPPVFTDYYTLQAGHFLLPIAIFQQELMESLGFYEFPPRFVTHISQFLGRTICSETNKFLREICAKVILISGGRDSDQFDRNLMPLIFKNFPSGVSSGVYKHCVQNHYSSKRSEFREYDFGPELNLKKYGLVKPPLYNMSLVTSPIIVYNGDGEIFFSPQKDVGRLVKELPNVIGNYRVNHPQFAHMDFLWGKSANTLVYDRIIDHLKSIDER